MLEIMSAIPFGAKVGLALLGVLLFLLHRYFTLHFGYWKKHGVKFEKPVPVFGTFSAMFLMKEHIADNARRLCAKYDGEPYFGLFQGRTPALMVTDLQLIKRIFVKDFAHFVDHSTHFSEEADPLQAKNLFNLQGQKWKDMRIKLAPTFTSGKIKAMFPLMKECVDNFDEHLQKISTNKEIFEAKELLGCLFTDIIGSCIFGIETNTIKDPNSQFRLMGRRLIEVKGLQVLRAMIVIFLPEVAQRLKLGILDAEVTNFFRKLVKDMMALRKTTKIERKDFMQLLIELKEKDSISNSDGSTENNGEGPLLQLSDDDLAAQATVFFLAGFETSSTVLSFALLELAANPDVQTKAHQEIDEALDESEKTITYEKLSELKYLDCILQESMRKYPPIAIHSRECTKAYAIPDSNVTIDKGVLVMIPNQMLQNDPKYFPNPDRFDPERFKDDDALHKYKYIYSPFGEGPRQCIGNRFAIVTAKLALLAFLRKYSVRFCDKTTYPVKLDMKQFLLTADGGTWLQIEKRCS